ncbi:MAG: hypothetical protein LUC96_15250 [Alistipes sp.]|uniref:Arm DNA-binding domain-containing protein n=1 Tax=Alistipes sp. TaxID=1872444 RepID=UPI0025C395E8|nr:Arm DNA-binding domain-containing protein [Alistipes sp.]MCD8276303.1 hypothetical protein [Alistipes sp.]
MYLRFTVNRRSRYVSTGINIPADDWDFDTQTLKTQNLTVQLRIYEQTRCSANTKRTKPAESRAGCCRYRATTR